MEGLETENLGSHPIQGLMKTAMESIKEMVEVNTVVGDPVEAQDGSLVVPVSKVYFGFAAGGGEYEGSAHWHKNRTDPNSPSSNLTAKGEMPFGGGAGGGASVQPVGFLVVGPGEAVRFLPVEANGAMADRIIDMVPQVLGRVQDMIKGDKKVLPRSGREEELHKQH